MKNIYIFNVKIYRLPCMPLWVFSYVHCSKVLESQREKHLFFFFFSDKIATTTTNSSSLEWGGGGFKARKALALLRP